MYYSEFTVLAFVLLKKNNGKYYQLVLNIFEYLIVIIKLNGSPFPLRKRVRKAIEIRII